MPAMCASAPSACGLAFRTMRPRGAGPAAFYPGTSPGDHCTGIAATFEETRAAFERAWQALAARCDLGPAFQAWREHRDWMARKEAMWARGEKLSSQIHSSMMRCRCGETFDSHDPQASYSLA